MSLEVLRIYLTIKTVLVHLCKKGHKVELLYDEKLSKDWPDDVLKGLLAKTEGLSAGYSLCRKDPWEKILFASRELLSYHSYLNRQKQDEFYRKRWERYIPHLFRIVLSRFSIARKILSWKIFRKIFEEIEHLSPPSSEIIESLEKKPPDVVLASPINMWFSEEVEYIKAAKSLDIPTAIQVLSWDNLTTKGIFHIIPDLTLAWNETQKNVGKMKILLPSETYTVTELELRPQCHSSIASRESNTYA